MVDEGLGYAITIDKLINTSGNSNLTFRPFQSAGQLNMHLIWKKYQVFSKASAEFLFQIQNEISH